MTVFSSSQPSLRARILPRFPASVIAGTGINISRSNGVYTFAANYDVPLSGIADITSDRLLGRDTAGTGSPEELTVSGGLNFTGSGGLTLSSNQRIRYLTVTLTGAPVSAGIKTDFMVPFSCTITKVTLLADQAGDIVLDIWKDTYTNFPPTVTGTITAAAKPTIVSPAFKYQDSTLNGWITAITAGDILRFNVDSAATVTRVVVALDVVTV